MPTEELTSTPTVQAREKPSGHSHDVLWVFDPTENDAPFAYTVGLGVRAGRAYELSCTGLPADLACAVLNNTAEQLIVDALDPEDGMDLDEVLTGYTVRLRPVDKPDALASIRTTLGTQPPVWQVLWPDAWGRFPGDPGHVDLPPQPLL
ncbi:DUF4262 domain-containing protein [Streptomyces sp. NPDC004735]|uniref:DUF4262 domain-containing protein n=1 Tax=Streptomyces sp. NPDC004735 TaxID=3156654 RepID=UPI0033ADF8A6